jgi:nitric oxide reductase NorD protein
MDDGALEILASAIAGRAVQVATAEPGVRTWTDGTTIFLESEPDHCDRVRLLAVQASLIAAGSLDATVMQQLRRNRTLATRYLAVEGHRALAANEMFLPPWLRSMIDRGVGDRMDSAHDSLASARDGHAIDLPWAFGTIDPRKVAAAAEHSDSRSSAAEDTTLEPLDEDNGGLELGNLLSSPVGGGGFVGRLLAKLLRPARARDGGGPPGADAPTHLGPGRPGRGSTTVSTAAAREALGGMEPGAAATHVYPEWDERRRRYRPGWCRVIEDVASADAGSSPVLPDSVALRRTLARLGTGLTPCRRRRQGEDIDLDAAVEARVGLLTGASHIDDVYIESLRRRRDLSVLVLLDVSGSAAEPGVAGRTVHEHQREAAGMLTAALDALGDRVALYAFSSRGRTAVRVSRVKGFGDRLDGRTCKRLDGLRPGAYTRLGAAIRHGAAVLEAESGTPRRLLVVLSDGFAYDHGYEGRHGEADARRALAETRRRGVGCLCLSVGADADLAALRRVFGASAHAAFPSAASLPRSVGPLFASALQSAEGRGR